jgi:TPR repeat protein
MTLKESDRALAMHWFELAAAQGDELASTRLADLRRTADTTGEAQIPKGATRLIDLMSPLAVRELEQNISDSRQAMRRAMQRIAEEERR